jgi:antitoxin VapB
MTVLIKNRETDALIRRVAKLKGVGLTEAVHEAVENELKRANEGMSLVERSRAFTQRLMERARPDPGQPVDKEFIDSLYEDD